MANTSTVCAMCGDVGFPDKLFQCMRCISRFQHLYCSNYYEEEPSKRARVCDWCLSEERTRAWHGPSLKKNAGDKTVKRGGDQEERGKSSVGASPSSSSKPAGRRYKLLKDVLC